MAAMINSLHCDKVFVYDVHSTLPVALINNCLTYGLTDLHRLGALQENTQDFSLVSPDAGAEKKVFDLAKDWQRRLVRAYKNRDVMTGNITGTTVIDKVADENCLVVDDICDGGATFIALAEELKKMGAKKLRLYVTHGIFSKGLDELLKWYEHIYCFHSFSDIYAMAKHNEHITVLTKKEAFNDD